MKRICIFCAILMSEVTYSQNQISGNLKDDKGFSVEFANVLLYNKADTIQVLQGTISDSAGNFYFDHVFEGTYLLRFHFIGYKPKSFFLQKHAGLNSDIGSVVLEYEVNVLDEVTITAKKELIQKTNTGFVVNAEATLSQLGGSAIDLLRNTPTVFVDAEGTVTLRGKAPMVLINGRNSKLDNLNALPASGIDKIEVITTPGASYDAEAENGIINIVLKKGKTDGLNGAFSIASGLSYSWRLNNSALINYKKRNWNVGLSYDNRLAERNRKAEGNRVNFNLPEFYYLTQKRNDERNEGTHNMRANIDYKDQRNTFGAELLASIDNEINLETLFNTLENKEFVFQNKNKRFSDERTKEKAGDIALKYERKLNKEGKLISANISTSFNDEIENTAINSQKLSSGNTQLGNPFLQRTSIQDNSFISTFRIDYAQKFKTAIFESGFKSLLRSFSTEFSQEDMVNSNYVFIGSKTGTLNFNEWVHAVYLQFRDKINEKWEYEIGLRTEQTANKGVVKSLEVDFKNSYLNLFSNLNIHYELSKNQNLRLSYGRRINRPSLGMLNPFTDITDSLTQRSGNPTLSPEISSNIDLGYSRALNQGSIHANVYYRNSKNTILQFTTLRSDGVLFTQPLNAGITKTVGFEAVFSYNLSRLWRSNWSGSIFNQMIDASNIKAEALNNVLSWNTKWINDFNFWQNSKLQIIGVYNAPTATIQGTRIAVYNVDFACQQKIMKEKARIGLIVTDVFNTQKNGFIWETQDFNFSRIFKVDTRAILLTFAYTLGTSFKEKLMENKFTNE